MTYWKYAPSGLIVPANTDTRPFANTCVAPGPLGDPGRPTPRRRHPIGIVEDSRICRFNPMPRMKVRERCGNLDPDRRAWSRCDVEEAQEEKC